MCEFAEVFFDVKNLRLLKTNSSTILHTGGLQECSRYKGIYAVSQVTEKGRESFISVCALVSYCRVHTKAAW